MALSNWDTLAFDETKEPGFAEFNSPLGVKVQIYKNWIYVVDQKAWEPKGLFVEPTIMEVQRGELTYKDVFILAERGPQEGIFCMVHTAISSQTEFKCLIGCGVYGYNGDKWEGVSQTSLNYLEKVFKAYYNENRHVFPKDFSIDFSKAIRYNQGDEYFAMNTDGDVPGSPVGQADEPVISMIFK